MNRKVFKIPEHNIRIVIIRDRAKILKIIENQRRTEMKMVVSLAVICATALIAGFLYWLWPGA